MIPTPQDLCAEINRAEIAMTLTRGAGRRRWKTYLRNCHALLRVITPIDPVTAAMTDDELLAELLGAK